MLVRKGYVPEAMATYGAAEVEAVEEAAVEEPADEDESVLEGTVLLALGAAEVDDADADVDEAEGVEVRVTPCRNPVRRRYILNQLRDLRQPRKGNEKKPLQRQRRLHCRPRRYIAWWHQHTGCWCRDTGCRSMHNRTSWLGSQHS